MAGRGVPTRWVKREHDLEDLTALVLPGGESSVMLKLAAINELEAPLCALIASGLPVLATCAGLILLARSVRTPEQQSLGMIDCVVERNGYGRQVHSAVHRVTGHNGLPDFDAVFIRAPRIVEVAPTVEVLAEWNGDPVLVRQDNVLAACFHPELVDPSPTLDLFLSAGTH